VTTIPLPPADSKGTSILDFEVTIDGNWSSWNGRVPAMDVETHKVGSPDIVVPTVDTVRHESLLYTWLADHRPMGRLIYILNFVQIV
jgi:dynein heavy chain 1